MLFSRGRELANRSGAKFGNKRAEYGGRKYHSKLEARVARELDLLLRGRAIKAWRPQVSLALEIPAPAGIEGEPITVARYIADFEIEHLNGSIEILEAKGYWTPEAKLKRKIFEATWLRAHPAVRYTIREA